MHRDGAQFFRTTHFCQEGRKSAEETYMAFFFVGTTGRGCTALLFVWILLAGYIYPYANLCNSINVRVNGEAHEPFLLIDKQ
jgi:hypothetical protein